VGEDMPRASNRITLHATERDANGLPVPNVHYDDHANNIAMRNHAMGRAAAIYASVGALDTMRVAPPPATHNLGTNRMASKREDGVVNRWGQSHDVRNLFVADGSQFPTASAANPTLTIVALAIRQAETMVRLMQRRDI
jgi:choline dehydrogenase-like flavoprotein